MKIVILDGGTTNPGDVSWEPIGALGDLTVYDDTPAELVTERAYDADAVILNRVVMSKEALDRLPNLKWIGMLATGYNAIDCVTARARNIDVCNVPAYCADIVAQQALTLLLTLCGNAQRFSDMVHANDWNGAVAASCRTAPLIELAGKNLGIVGYGDIGQRMTRLGLALGMKVLLYSRTRKDCPAGCTWVDLETLFRESDAVSLHCPLTDDTRGLVGRQLLGLMKPTAFLVNTSRGAVIDSVALAEALNAGKLAGAGLDVLDQEPPGPEHPLLHAKNCVITPHIAWSSRDARARLIDAVAENLRGYLTGNPRNVVN